MKYVPVQQQNFLPVCGVMAIAFAVSIFLHIDQITVELDLSKARAHLKSCLSCGVIKPFPVVPGQKKHHYLKTAASSNSSVNKSNAQDKNSFTLLNSYFTDQFQKADSRKRKYNECLLSNEFNEINFASQVPFKKTCKHKSDFESKCDAKLRKQKSRRNAAVRDTEKLKDKFEKKNTKTTQ